MELLESRCLLTDPLLTSWLGGELGQFAEVINPQNVAAGPVTTWTGQSNPVLGDVEKISFSTTAVYIEAPELASYVMGPWYLDANHTQPFPGLPLDQNAIFRFDLTPTSAANGSHVTTNLGATGLLVNGVAIFDQQDGNSYKKSSGADSPQGDHIWNRNAAVAEAVTFDHANAHQPQSGEYHNHVDPIALRAQLHDNVAYSGPTTPDLFPHDSVDKLQDSDSDYYDEVTTNLHHSPILGWAFDGFPIYGPYGYSDPMDPSSAIVRQETSFRLRNISTRITLPGFAAKAKFGDNVQLDTNGEFALNDSVKGPNVSSQFPLGHYIEDYEFVQGLGDLDIYNSRFTKTPEYPSGTQAYFTTIDAAGNAAFPFFTGRQFFGDVTSGRVTSIGESVTLFYDANNPSISINDVSVSEATSSAVFTVTLATSSSKSVTVDFATSNGTAIGGSDFTVTSGTLTFSPGVTTKTISVAITGDSMLEDAENFFVSLSNATNAKIKDGQGEGTITDNTTAPTLSINDVMTFEGNTGTTNAVFTVTLSKASENPVTVDYVTVGNSAIAGVDFSTTTNTLTFDPGQTTRNVTVVITGDTIYEAAENYFVNLSGATNATISDNQGIGTIKDDDLAPTLSIEDKAFDEGVGNALVKVSLSNKSSVDVTVVYTTANSTALSPDDYSATSQILTIPAGADFGYATVPVIDDLLDEPDQTFFVNLSSATGASIADKQGIGTILDNDSIPRLSVIGDTVSEGAGTVEFKVRLSEPSGLPIKVNYATVSGTAVSGDYLSKKGSLLFGPGETEKTLVIRVLEDTRHEANETFEMTLTGPTNATLASGQDRATSTILDNDAAPTLTISDKIVTEGTSSTPRKMAFKVLLSAVSGLPVTVNYATLGVGSTATASDDYTAVPITSLEIAAGRTSATITVDIVGDALDEIDEETFIVELTSPVDATLADAQGTGTIRDNDLPPKVRIGNVTKTEGTGDLIFTLTLSAASNLPVTVFFDTADSTAKSGIDYVGVVGGNYTFNPGAALTTTINVSIINDPAPEKTKTFVLNLKNVLGAVFAKGIGTILDNV